MPPPQAARAFARPVLAKAQRRIDKVDLAVAPTRCTSYLSSVPPRARALQGRLADWGGPAEIPKEPQSQIGLSRACVPKSVNLAAA